MNEDENDNDDDDDEDDDDEDVKNVKLEDQQAVKFHEAQQQQEQQQDDRTRRLDIDAIHENDNDIKEWWVQIFILFPTDGIKNYLSISFANWFDFVSGYHFIHRWKGTTLCVSGYRTVQYRVCRTSCTIMHASGEDNDSRQDVRRSCLVQRYRQTIIV